MRRPLARRPLVPCCALVSLLPAPVLAQGFGSATTHVHPGIRHVKAGDVNGDGFADLVTTGTEPGGFGLYLGTSGGGLTPATAPAVPFGPSALVLCDLNGDGSLDIAALDPGVPMLQLGKLVKLLGDGAGGFGAATNVGTGFNGQSLGAGDVNADAIVDVVVGSSQPTAVYVFRGSGGGAFLGPLTQAAYFSPSSVSLADLDVNGTRDVLVCNGGTHNVSVFLNGGTGALAPMVNYPTNSDTRTADVADVNGDGIPDVVAAAGSVNPGVTCVPGLGGGVLGAPAVHPGGEFPFDVVLVDADADGALDALVSDYLNGSMRVFSGNGSGAFALTQTVQTASGAFDVETADMNLDGHVDVMTVNVQVQSFSVIEQIPPAVVGAASYGTGSPGCAGELGLGVNSAPRVNTPSFAYTLTHAPANALGLLLATDVKDTAGTDVFTIGILLHCGLLTATEVYGLDAFTDGSGSGRAASPLPNNPALVGMTYAACAVFVENAADGLDCGGSPFALVSSRGLEITIQP